MCEPKTIIIPPGLVNPNETTIVEIPIDLEEEQSLIAVLKDTECPNMSRGGMNSNGSMTRVTKRTVKKTYGSPARPSSPSCASPKCSKNHSPMEQCSSQIITETTTTIHGGYDDEEDEDDYCPPPQSSGHCKDDCSGGYKSTPNPYDRSSYSPGGYSSGYKPRSPLPSHYMNSSYGSPRGQYSPGFTSTFMSGRTPRSPVHSPQRSKASCCCSTGGSSASSALGYLGSNYMSSSGYDDSDCNENGGYSTKISKKSSRSYMTVPNDNACSGGCPPSESIIELGSSFSTSKITQKLASKSGSRPQPCPKGASRVDTMQTEIDEQLCAIEKEERELIERDLKELQMARRKLAIDATRLSKATGNLKNDKKCSC